VAVLINPHRDIPAVIPPGGASVGDNAAPGSEQSGMAAMSTAYFR
jgi:hypothetical protein